MTNMTKLSKLHARLADLRRRRQGVRLGTGYSALLLAVLWGLAAVFLVDWLLEMNRPQRVVAMAICVGAIAWAFRRYVRSWLVSRESELDMAIMVQKQQHIDTDLVAALQFEWPEAYQWGSVELEQAVIDHTAEISPQLDVMKGLSRRELSRRALILAVTLILTAAAVWRFPDHTRAFLNRLLLGSRHYPTKTVILAVEINGTPIDLTAWRRTVLKSPFGQPVKFKVTCSGRLPTAGRAELKALSTGQRTTVPLEPKKGPGLICAKHPPGRSGKLNLVPFSACPSPLGMFAGELPRLVDSVNYQFYLGDAWTDRARLVVVPLAAIDVELEVIPPAYAKTQGSGVVGQGSVPKGLRQISVIEGSRVELRIRSDKSLEDATLSIDENDYPLTQDDSDRSADGPNRWKLDSDKTPLSAVVETIRYEIQVTDIDGLQLQRPIGGVIRIKADHRPRIAGSIVTPYILPTANPTVGFLAGDDYGLARVAVVRQVIHAEGGRRKGEGGKGKAEVEDEVDIYKLPKGEEPQTAVESRHVLQLGSLGLVKGDQLKITLKAVDYRGPRKGKSTSTEPILFHVTDEQGILEKMAETDLKSVQRLETMIERQTNLGGDKGEGGKRKGEGGKRKAGP